jgi:hypothetical protein
MGWTEGVLVVSLVVVRLYSLGLEQARARIVAGRAESDDLRVVNQRWLQFLLLSSSVAALLLGTSALLASAGAGTIAAGVRVGMVLWASEALVHLGGVLELLRRMRAGHSITVEAAVSLPAATWSSTFMVVPVGALVGRVIAHGG